MRDERAERLAQNETFYRTINERISSAAAEDHHRDELYEFYCECSDLNCRQQLQATLSEFDAAHDRPERFFIIHGHLTPDIEGVVERNDRYSVVEKRGAAGAAARKLTVG